MFTLPPQLAARVYGLINICQVYDSDLLNSMLSKFLANRRGPRDGSRGKADVGPLSALYSHHS